MYDFYDKYSYSIKPNDSIYKKADYVDELKRRINIEKKRKSIVINYYRINKKYVFDLPIENGWDKDLPVTIENITPYPYAIWLFWELRERWDILFLAYKEYDDICAKNILQNEIIKAFAFDKYAIGRKAYLGTAHFAMCVCKYLLGNVFDNREFIIQKSKEFLDNHYMDWLYEFKNIDESDKVKLLHNIQVILVFSGLALSKIINYTHYSDILDLAKKILKAYKNSRRENPKFTEMAAYDSYTLDTILDYVFLFNREEEIEEYRDDLFDVLYSICDSLLPGRCDLLANIGDVEEEMQFHSNVLFHLGNMLNSDYAKSCLYKINPQRLQACTLGYIISDFKDIKKESNIAITRGNASTFVLRTGQKIDDILLCFSVANWNEGHVHYDSGSFVYSTFGKEQILDPGYQQYIKGEERDFTYGKYAHNAPIINGKQQMKRGCKIIKTNDLYALIEISDCYDLHYEKVYREFYIKDKVAYVNDYFENFNICDIEYSLNIPYDCILDIKNGILTLEFEKYIFYLSASFSFEKEDIKYPKIKADINRIIHKLSIEGKEEIKFKMWIEVK